MSVEIRSNGSKWAGEAPDSLDRLIEVLNRETLDPRFEEYGDFAHQETDPEFLAEHPELSDTWHLFGNFLTVSHVFNIRGTRDELAEVIAAIEQNKRTAEYQAARPFRYLVREVVAAEHAQMSCDQGPEWNDRLTASIVAQCRDEWEPGDWERWRHGGWYVGNLRYPSGAVGCVSNNYADKKWRIACDPRPFDEAPTFRNRRDAAIGERDLIASLIRDTARARKES